MSRKGGCPFNIRDYSVSIMNPVTQEAVRVKGLERMSVETESDTGDGRTGESAWSEKFIKSRSVSGSLEGRPIMDIATGAADAGQALMHAAALSEGGCGGDRTILVADAVGRAVAYDCVVTGESAEADEDGETVKWEWEGVGCPRPLAYVQAEAVGFEADGDPVAQVALAPGETARVKVAFTPENASNRRFGYCLADESVAAVADVSDGMITLRAAAAGETALTVRSMNNGLTAALAVVVTDGAAGAP